MNPAAAWTIRTLGAGLLALLLSGCASEPKAVLLVQVSDAGSGAPIAGAKVQAETAARNHPLSVSSLLGQTGPMTSTGFTDANGQATLEYLSGRPVRIAALSRGYPILTMTIEEPWLGPSEALSDPGPDGNRLRVHVRE
jgi:hypothetical protein